MKQYFITVKTMKMCLYSRQPTTEAIAKFFALQANAVTQDNLKLN